MKYNFLIIGSLELAKIIYDRTSHSLNIIAIGEQSDPLYSLFVPANLEDLGSISDAFKQVQTKIDLVIVDHSLSLKAGVVDFFVEQKIPCVGSTSFYCNLETNQEFRNRHLIGMRLGDYLENNESGELFELHTFYDGQSLKHIPSQNTKNNQSDLTTAEWINGETILGLIENYEGSFCSILTGRFRKTNQGLKLVDYQTRFENTNILTQLKVDLVDFFMALGSGRLDQLNFKPVSSPIPIKPETPSSFSSFGSPLSIFTPQSPRVINPIFREIRTPFRETLTPENHFKPIPEKN